MYRDADEIEKEKELLTHERGLSEARLSVAPEMDIMDYCKKRMEGKYTKSHMYEKGLRGGVSEVHLHQACPRRQLLRTEGHAVPGDEPAGGAALLAAGPGAHAVTGKTHKQIQLDKAVETWTEI